MPSLTLANSLRATITYSPFSPASLFSGGAPGVWYDPSDYTTLFQNSAGTTPVTAVEQPVGLMLDKSQGLVLGVELVVNGDFSDGLTGWLTTGPTFTATAGGVLHTGSANYLYQSVLTANKYYKITFTISGRTVGNFELVSAFWNTTYQANTNGTHTIIASPKQAQSYFYFGTGFDGIVDNISVKELPGNHAFQSTSASRPVLSARYNLLTKTEQFDDAVWVKNSATVAANGSAWRITDATTVASANIQQSVTVIANTPHTIRLEFEKQASGIFGIAVGNFFCYVNHATLATFNETMFAGLNASSSVALVSGTRYRLTCTVTLASSTSNVRIYAALGQMSGDINGSSNPAATGFLDVYQADLRVSNDGINLPAYQRVNTATDYTTTGFLPYLKFDGVDDSMSTNSINFTGTDKLSVFAGVRKLSNTAYQLLYETSTQVNVNNGAFNCFATDGPNGTYGFNLKGTSAVYYVPTGYTAPITSVLSCLNDIGGASLATELIPRINGALAQVGGGGTTAGTGNFGNYPLFIGRRNNATNPFNGQLYSMVIVGKQVTATELSSTETYTAIKTGVTL